MQRLLNIIGLVGLVGVFITPAAQAASLAERFSGYVLLDTSSSGEAWYVYPITKNRYYLGTGLDAYNIMRHLGVGMSNKNLAKIPTSSQSTAGDTALRQRFAGRILLQVEDVGQAWYVSPKNLKRYALGGPNTAFQVLVGLVSGITSTRLGEIPISTDLALLPGSVAAYRGYTISTTRGSFPIQVATFGRNTYTITTDSAELKDCDSECSAKSLSDYVGENSGFAGMNGTYFCPPDYSSCASKVNSFLPPVFNTAADTMLQEDALPFHAGPLLVQHTDHSLSYFHRTIDFGYTVNQYEQRTGKQVRSAIANYPSLMESGKVVVGSEPMEAGQTTKASRGGIGFNDSVIFLVRASGASVTDLAYIFQVLGAKNAMNLDGGGSSALYYGGTYKVGPGRLLPNAVVIKRR